MLTVEMKFKVPEVEGGRCISAKMENGYIFAKYEIGENGTASISESALECKIDPNIFEGEWLEHKPTTRWQRETLNLYNEAKAKGRLHSFTCMTIDPSVKDRKLVYQKGLPIITGFSQRQWAKMLRDYDPSRNSRQMARTEYACRNLFLIQKLVESGYEIKKAWEAVCDNSKVIGNYLNSADPKYYDFERTGSREVCGFCDLGNARKLIAEDPWDKSNGFWVGSGTYHSYSDCNSVAFSYYSVDEDLAFDDGVGMLALD